MQTPEHDFDECEVFPCPQCDAPVQLTLFELPSSEQNHAD